ncbi:MAG: hypothetical protein AB4911_18310 [Oscillochloridaceae bacterium umkhey_bin13]
MSSWETTTVWNAVVSNQQTVGDAGETGAQAGDPRVKRREACGCGVGGEIRAKRGQTLGLRRCTCQVCGEVDYRFAVHADRLEEPGHLAVVIVRLVGEDEQTPHAGHLCRKRNDLLGEQAVLEIAHHSLAVGNRVVVA